MTISAEILKGLGNQLRHLGRVESGRRILALLALGLLAQRHHKSSWDSLLLRARYQQAPDGLNRDLYDIADAVEQALPRLHGALTGALVPDLAQAGVSLPGLIGIAGELIEQASGSSPADLFNATIAEFSQGAPAGDFETQRPIAQLVAELLAPQPDRSVFDPRCGLGALLAEVARKSPHSTMEGQDLNPVTAALARLRLHFMGVAADIRLADALSGRHPLANAYDYAVCAPPIAVKLTASERTPLENAFGLARPLLRSETAYLLHCANSLRAEGRAVVLMPIGFLFRGQDEEVRSRLLKARQIEGVVSLPTGVVPWTEIAFAAVILRAANEGPDRIRLIDGERLDVRTHRGAERLTSTHIEDLLSRYHGPEGPEAAHVEIGKLLEEDVNLRPQRWLQATEEEEIDVGATYKAALQAEQEATALLKELDSVAVLARLMRGR